MKRFAPEEIKKLFPAAIERNYPPGQIIAFRGDEPPYFYYICDGAVKYYDIQNNGKECVIHVIGENSFFPIFYFFGRFKQVESFYGALGPVKILMIHAEDAKRRIKENPEFSSRVLDWLVYETSFVMMRIRTFESSESKLKLMQTLNYLMQRHSERHNGEWYRVKFNISQQLLGDMTGLTRETVNSSIKELEKRKLMQTPKHLSLEIHRPRLEKALQAI